MILAVTFLFSTIVNPNINVPLFTTDKQILGSSVAISDNQLITAKHVVDDNLGYALCEDDLLKVTVVKTDEKADLALIKTEKPCKAFVKATLGTVIPKPGEDVFTIGCPRGLCSLVSKGVVSAYLPPKENRGPRMMSDIKLWFGGSGGPVLNEKLELVGIASALWGFSRAYNSEEDSGFSVYSQNYAMISPLPDIYSLLGLDFKKVKPN